VCRKGGKEGEAVSNDEDVQVAKKRGAREEGILSLTEAIHGGGSRWRLDARQQPRVWRRGRKKGTKKKRRRRNRRRKAL
jgi:hypothetical protein